MSLRSGLRCLFLYLCAVVAAFAADFRPGMVLVKYHPDATEADIAELQSRKGLRLTKHIKLFGIYAYAYDAATTGPVEFSRELAKEPIVETAEPDHVRELKALDPEYPKQWSLRNTGQVVNGKSGPAGFDIRWPEANLLYKPKSTLVVGVIDSGVTLLHPDLVGSVHVKTSESINGFNGIDEDGNGLIDDFWGYDWYDLDPLPTDQHGHGTLVSSIIAGTIGNGQGIAGITNSVKIRGYRVFDQFARGGKPKFRSGGYAVSDVLASVATAVDDGCKVINLSLGGSAYSALEAGAFEEISTMQVLCVIASGNDGKNNDLNPTYPASYPAASIIAVAAQDRTGGLANFSNYGVQTTDLAAPGTDIRGADVTRRVIYASNFSTGLNGWSPFRYTANDYSYASWTTSGGYLVDRTYGSYYSPWTDTYARSPLIDARNYSGVRVEYEGAFDIANDTLSVDLSLDGLNWDTYKQYAWAGSGVDQFDASDMDLSRFYLRFRLRSDGSSQGIGAGISSVTISAINDLDTANPSYQFSNGTSFSAPIVSGVVCMVWTQQPSLTAAQVKEIVLKSVRKVPALDGKVLTGGMVDAEAALKLAAVYAGDVPPMVTVPPRGGFFLQGDSVTLTVGSTSGLSVTYQWRKNGVNISGERGSTFSIGSLAIADAGMYDVVVTSQAGSVTSASAQLTVSARLPSIVTQPVLPASVMIARETYQMSCSAAGTPPLTYQWMKNGVAIAGATSPIFSIGQLATVDAGAYSVKVGNAAGSVISSAVNVAVTQRPAFTTNLPTAPVNLTAGGAHVLFVAATGTPLPAYQWRRNGVNIPGAVGAAYLVLAGTVEASNTYDVVITNTAGSVTSAAATVRTNVPVTVASAPAARSVVAGQPASFSVTAAGTGPFTYQWLRNGLAIAGATASTYDIAAVSGADAGIYSARVTGPIGSVISTGGTLSVLTPTSFITQPSTTQEVFVPTGVPKVLTVSVGGSGPFTYQWRKDGVIIPAATLTSYTIPASTQEASAYFDVVVGSPVGVVVSNATKVSVCLPVTITTQPVAVGVVLGRDANFTVGVSGTGPFTYQWMRNGVPIVGATGSSFTAKSVASLDAAVYSVKVTGPVGTTVSQSVPLSIVTPPAIITQPNAVAKVERQSATFVVSASGTAPLSYQWLKDDQVIPGATSPVFSIASLQASDAGAYKLLVTNSGGKVHSLEAVLVVITQPVITAQPQPYYGVQSDAKGTYDVSSFDFNTNAQGWILGATSADRSTSGWLFGWEDPLNPIDGLLECEDMTGLYVDRFARSPWISLAGVTNPTVTFRANTYGGPGILAIEASSDGLSWVPLKSSVPQAASGNDTYTCSLAAYAGAGCYVRARLAGVNIAGVFDDCRVSGYKYPTGASAQFSTTATGGALSYQWYKDGLAIAGATVSSYSVGDINLPGATGAYTVKISNAAGSITSSQAVLALLVPPVFTNQPVSASRYIGQSVNFTVGVSSVAPVSYQWYKDGVPISGATGSALNLPSAGIADGGNYKVRVSNAAADYLSTEVSLRLAPAILSQPTSFYGPAKTKALIKISEFTFEPDLQGWVAEPGSNNLGTLSWINQNARSLSTIVAGKSNLGWYGAYGERQTGRARGFIYDGKSLTNIDFPSQTNTWVRAMTSTGLVVGAYGSSGENYFTLRNGVYSRFSLPGYSNAWILGAYGDTIYGGLYDGVIMKGFIHENGSTRLIVYPGAYSTRLQAASEGKVVGAFQMSQSGAYQQFYYDGATFNVIAKPGALQTTLNAVGQGKIGGTYYDDSWKSHGFVYDGVNYTTVDPPGQTADNFVTGISSSGVVGTYYDSPTGFDARKYSYEREGDLTRVIAVPITPTQYSFRGLQCDNLSGTNGSAVVKSPAISLAGSSSSECAVRIRLVGAVPGDLVIEASSDQVNWESLFVNGDQSGDYKFSLANYDGKTVYLRARMQGSYNLLEIEKVTVSGVKYDVDPALKLSVYAVGPDCSYQWYKDGTAIAGATSAEYTLPDRYAAGAQGSYTVRVTNPAGSVTSSPAVLKLYTPPVIAIQPVSQTIKGPTFAWVTARSFDFTFGPDGWTYGSYVGNSSPHNWAWRSNAITDRLTDAYYSPNTDTFTQSPFLSLAGIGSASLTFRSAHQLYTDGLDSLQVQASSDGVNWSTLRTITGNSGSFSTSTAIYTASLSAFDNLGCFIRFRLVTSPFYNSTGVTIDDVSVTGLAVATPGGSVTFSASVADISGCTYQWYKNDVLIPGATSNSLSISSVVPADAGSYNVKVTNPAGTVFSNYASLTVRN